MSLQPPSNLSAYVDNTLDLSTREQGIDGYNLQTHVVTMNFKSPALHMILGGQISYTDLNGLRTKLYINCSLSIFDFLRPMKISTDVYGKKWVDTSYEKRQKIRPVYSKSIQDILMTVQKELNFEIVQVIGEFH